MRLQTVNPRSRYAQIGVPVAVIGALASVLTAAPATAAASGERGTEQRPSTPPRAVPAASTPTNYTVQSGDTVSSIAQSFGLRVTDVLAWNDLGWRSVIFPGQTLRLTPPGAPAPAAPTASSAYTVVAGDTIFGIAQKHGTTVDAVLAANGLTRESVIYPGQSITVSGAPATAAPTPDRAPAPSAPAAVHTVVAGDTIFGIAQKYGTTVDAVLAANGLGADSIIYPGQSIVTSVATPASAPAADAQLNAVLDAEQAGNAARIIQLGRELGVSDRGIAIALATAMVESWIRNLDWGDRDSLGLFQQRPSTGWGTAEQVRDRDRSIRAFYGGPSDPNGTTTRGLLDVAGWENLSFSEAAQAVQISAYPERYGQWERQAYEWIALHG